MSKDKDIRDAGSHGNKTPIRGIFFGCCAWAKETVSRRAASSRGLSSFFVIALSSYYCLLPRGYCQYSLDYLIRSVQHRLRNRQTDLLRRLEIDDELKFFGCSTGRSAGFVPLRILST